jgi:hypothetical protein
MSMRSLPKLESSPIFNHTSIFALSAVTVLLATAYNSSFVLLRAPSTTKVRVLFIWHLFDALIHFTLEASYLYNVFFTSMSTLDIAYTRGMHSLPMTPAGVFFLGDSKHLHGSFYGTSTAAKLWQEYAKADKRWGGSDLTVASLELLTVFVMAPLALYVCHLLRKQEHTKAWFWMAVVATGELYGGFMTFLPEWLAGSPNLDTSNFLTLWVYLGLFKAPWVLFPLWILWNAYQALTRPVQPSTRGILNGSAKEPLKVNIPL